MPSAGLHLALEAGDARTTIPILCAPGGHLLARVPASESGLLALRSGAAELARVRVLRRTQPAHREPSARFTAVVMPSHPTRAHLLGDACWLDVQALPGVRLEVALCAGEIVEEEVVPADGATPARTARCVASMRRRIEQALGVSAAAACEYELRISNADEPTLPPVVQRFPSVGAAIGFDVEGDGAALHADADVDPPTITRLVFEQDGVQEIEAAMIGGRIDRGAPGGIYLARSRGAAAALAWASDLEEAAQPPSLRRPARGALRAAAFVNHIRACEAASLAPGARVHEARLVRRAALAALGRELVASLCGRRWLAREEDLEGASVGGEAPLGKLIELFAPLLWVPRSWLGDNLPRLLEEVGNPLEALELACREGVGDALQASDERDARHLLLLFTRATMASADGDVECLRWANANIVRPRLVRLVYLASPTRLGDSRGVEASEAQTRNS